MWCGTQTYNATAWKDEAGGDHESKAKLGYIMKKMIVLYYIRL